MWCSKNVAVADPDAPSTSAKQYEGWALRTKARAVYAEDTGLLGTIQHVACTVSPGMLFLFGASLQSSVAQPLWGSNSEAHCLVGAEVMMLPNGPLFPGGDSLGPCLQVNNPWWPDGRLLLVFPAEEFVPYMEGTEEGHGGDEAQGQGQGEGTRSPGRRKSTKSPKKRGIQEQEGDWEDALPSVPFHELVDALIRAAIQCPRLDVQARAMLPSANPLGELGIGASVELWQDVRVRAGAVGRCLYLGTTPAYAAGRYDMLVPGRAGFIVKVDDQTQVHVTSGQRKKKGKGVKQSTQDGKGADPASITDDLGHVILRGIILHRGHSWFLPTGTRHMHDFVLAPKPEWEAVKPAALKPAEGGGENAEYDDEDSESMASDEDAGPDGAGPANGKSKVPELSDGWKTAAERWWGPERRLYLALHHLSLLQQGKWGSYISSLAARIQGAWKVYRTRKGKREGRRVRRLQQLQRALTGAGYVAQNVVDAAGKLVCVSLGSHPFRAPRDAAAVPSEWCVEVVSLPSSSVPSGNRTVLLLVGGLTQPDAGLQHAWGSLLSVVDTERVVVLRLSWAGMHWLDDAFRDYQRTGKGQGQGGGAGGPPGMRTPAAALVGLQGLALLPDLMGSDSFKSAWRECGPVGLCTSALLDLMWALSLGEGPRAVRAGVLGEGRAPPLVVMGHSLGARLVLSALSSIGGEAAAYGGIDEGTPTCVPSAVVLLGAATTGPEDAGQMWSAAAAAVSRGLVNVWSSHDLVLSRCLHGKGPLAPRLGLDMLGLQAMPAGARPVAGAIASAPPGVMHDVDASGLLAKATIGGHSYANVLPTLIKRCLPTLLPLV